MLKAPGRPTCYVEVKNASPETRPRCLRRSLSILRSTLRSATEDGRTGALRRTGGEAEPAEFPDAVTARGTRHLVELADQVAAGTRAIMVYGVQREDCDSFAIAADIDPTHDAAFHDALARGVEVLCYACKVSLEGIELDRPLAIEP